ncbi:MAG: discoidin domain-containing protein, partial [Chitinophagaceae bacterium]
HVSTTVLSVKNTFERRLGIWPTGFDNDGVMYCNTTFGDYPHYIKARSNSPQGGERRTHKALSNAGAVSRGDSFRSNNTSVGKASPNGGGLERTEYFTGWMLLNYNKPVQVSSTLGGYVPNHAVDELAKTYWSATTGHKGEWIQTDLGNISTVNAIQINYADQDVSFPKEMDSIFLGKTIGLYHQYKLYYSTDGKKWFLLVDKSNNKKDVPHDYVELEKPVRARFIKLENMHMPTGKFAISGFRVFGNANGAKPEPVKNFIVLRTEQDKRSAFIKWRPVDNAFAYNIYYGTHPEKLYTSIMIHANNEYWLKTMDSQKTYYFTIESINENGVSERTPVFKSE